MNLGNLTEDQRRQLNELLSASTISSIGGQGYLNGQREGRLSDLMNPQPQPQMMPDGMPENYIQRGNNPPIPIQPSPRSMGPALDYSSAPVDFGGMKGYRVKGDPMSIVMADGRIVRMGADTGADRKRMAEDLQMQMTRQKLSEGDIDLQTKKAQLVELMGMDPAQMGGIVAAPVPTQTPGFFPENGAQPSGAQQQATVLNQKMLTRRFGNAPEGTRWDAQGNAVKVPGYEKPLTEFQGKSANFGGRAAAAHEILTTVGTETSKNSKGETIEIPGSIQPGMIKRAAQSTPIIGEGLGTLLNWTQSKEQQQVEQAQRDFVNAVLRQESGAAIAESEFNNAQKQYFPQPGDTPDVILQKKRNREQAIAGFAVSAGDGGKKLITSAREKTQAIFEAHKAIKQGADKAAVAQRLNSMGITDHGIK